MRNFSWLLWGASTAFLERDARPADAPATPPVEEAVERGPRAGWVIRGLALSTGLDLGIGQRRRGRNALGAPPATQEGEIGPRPRRRRDPPTTKTTGIDVGREEGVGRQAVSQARSRDSLYHFTSLAMPSEKGVLGS